MLKSVVYVSTHELNLTELTEQLADIATVAKHKNALVSISGALIATERYFAQILQGPSVKVDDLMLVINSDQRHSNVTIIEDIPIKQKNCPDWTLAYVGKAEYIDRHIAPLIDFGGQESSAVDRQRVVRMMRAFCRA